jgi:AraC-like DNA-binding protein
MVTKMKKTILHIKNMVCNRCIMSVEQTLEELGYEVIRVELGSAEVAKELSLSDKSVIKQRLDKLGFELIEDKTAKVIDDIKTVIIKMVHHSKGDLESISISEFLSLKLNYNYTYLSKIFSDVEGITIERFFILQKIERVKELLIYDELSLKEISYRLGYSSVQHLSTQFKKELGITPSAFKKAKGSKRKPLDKVGKKEE